MNAPANGGRRPRGSLAPEAIIAAAADFVEEYGLRNLTMAALARAMDVPVTSIHWHFRTRDDLIEALTERVTADVFDALPPITTDGPWDEELIAYFEALRRQLLKTPSFIDLSLDRSRLLGRPAIKDTINKQLENEISLLVNAGVTPADAYRIFHVCSVYVRGFCIFELVAARQYREPGGPSRDFPPLDPETFPWMSQIDLLSLSWDDADRQFRLGLDVLVAGIKQSMGTRLGTPLPGRPAAKPKATRARRA